MLQPIKNDRKSLDLWLLIVLVTIASAVFMTHPFLRLPYDPWEHLIKIRSIYDEGRCFLFWPEDWSSFWFWHWMWAKLFGLFGIDRTFTWAYVIHYCQFLLALGCVYYFSLSLLRLLAGQQRATPPLKTAALFSTVFWLVGNGTFSVELQQAWIVWYSLTYQGFTIPVFWLICGMTTQLLFDNELSPGRALFYLIIIPLGLAAIVSFHPTEALYYLIFLFACLVFTPRMAVKVKMFGILVFIAMVAAVGYAVYTLKLPGFWGLRKLLDIPQFLESMHRTGGWLVEDGGNKVTSSFSELAAFSTAAGVLFCALYIIFTRGRTRAIWAALVLYAACILIVPMTSWAGGIVGTLVHKDIVWRFFFASPWFVFIPAITCKLFSGSKHARGALAVSMTMLLALSFYLSQKHLTGTLAANARSLADLFNKSQVGLQYDQASRDVLKGRIKEAVGDAEKKDVILYTRGDAATLARGIYGYYAYSHRRVIKPMRQFYDSRLDKRYSLVPVKLPDDFPKDRHVFLHFDLDARYLSEIKENLDKRGDSQVAYHVDSIDSNPKYLFVSGWALLKGIPANSEVYVVLEADDKQYVFDTSEKFRADLGVHFGHRGYENNGFLATIPRREIVDGVYSLALFVRYDGYVGFGTTDITIVLK